MYAKSYELLLKIYKKSPWLSDSGVSPFLSLYMKTNLARLE